MSEDNKIDSTINNNIGKLELIELVRLKGNFTNSEATRAVELVISIIEDSVKAGLPVSIRKFGVFIPAVQKAFTARNPQTGESVEVAEKKTVRFKPSKVFKSYVNDELLNVDDDDDDETE